MSKKVIFSNHIHVKREFTHGDVGQLVGGAVGVDAVEVGAHTVHSPKHKSSADVALIPGQ